MAFEHTLHAEIYLKCDATVDALIEALKPLMKECGWSKRAVLSNNLYGEDEIEITYGDDGMIESVTIYTAGEVPSHYRTIVAEVAAGLKDLVSEPGNFVLHDLDNSNPDECIELIWFGEAEAVRTATIQHAWEAANASLARAGAPESALALMNAIGRLIGHRTAADTQPPPQYTGPMGARKFYEELVDTFESFGEVCEQFKVETLFDCFCLQNAILAGSTIDGPDERSSSRIVDLVGALPSASAWKTYITIQQ
jgi:hypothetical protein